MRSHLKNIFATKEISEPQKSIKALNMAINLHKQEDKIFQATTKERINILDRELIDYQLLVELLERFWPQEKIEYLLETQHELMLSYRFMLIGHYNSAGKHLRSFLEHNIDYLYQGSSYKQTTRVKQIVEQSIYKQDELLRLDSDQVYIFYSYLSNTYTHHSDPFEKLDLDREKLREVRGLIVAVILLSSRLIFGIHGETIEHHYKDTILHPIRLEKQTYWPYIQTLLGTSRFYNTMMEWWLYKKLKGRKWRKIDMRLRGDEEYYEAAKEYYEQTFHW